MSVIRVAIDGPAASGKTSTARFVARRLGYRYLDSGALYRAAALKVLRAGLDPDDAAAVMGVLRRTEMDYDPDGRVRLDGVIEGESLRTSSVADAASRLGVHPEVRTWVNERLRASAAEGGVVMEGRDIGTVVLPDAEVKIFLVARLGVRADRRGRDLADAGRSESRSRVEDQLRARDERDRGRREAPLRAADDAEVIDGSDLSFAEQVERVLAVVAEKQR